MVDLCDGALMCFAGVSVLDWSPDGERVVYKRQQGKAFVVREYDAPTREDRDLPWVPPGTMAFRWSPDGTQAAVSVVGHDAAAPSALSLLLLHAGSGSERQLMRWSRPSTVALAWSKDGRFLYVCGRHEGGDWQCDITRVHVPDGRRTVVAQKEGPAAFALAADETQMLYREHPATTDRAGYLFRALDLESLRVKRLTWPGLEQLTCDAVFSADGKAVTASDQQGRLWRYSLTDGHATLIAEQGYSPQWVPGTEGEMVYLAKARGKADSPVQVWRARPGAEPRLLTEVGP